MAKTDKFALVTSEKKPDLNPGDDLLSAAFAARGVETFATPWSQENVNWEDFDAIIIRSCHDYYKRPEEFRRWLLDRKASERTRMWNNADLILWNMNKKYLKFFRKNGIMVPETLFVERGSRAPDLTSVLKKNSWDKAVVKPAISATGFRTFTIDHNSAGELQTTFEEYLQDGDMMIQKFLYEIQTNGEYDLVYIGRELSHTIQKVPAEGDFRVHVEHGGKGFLVVPPAAVKETADKVISLVKEDIAYARVDLVMTAGCVSLMELELIEPRLYFDRKEGAADKFVEVLLEYHNGNASNDGQQPFNQSLYKEINEEATGL